MSNSSIWLIDRTLSGATTLGQSGPGSDVNEGVLYIPQNIGLVGRVFTNDLADQGSVPGCVIPKT